jgi:hypothetical protein
LECSQGGKPVTLPIVAPSQQVLMTCTKPEDQPLTFRLDTNAGLSDPVTLPAYHKLEVVTGTTIRAEFKPDHIPLGAPLRDRCYCVSVFTGTNESSGSKTVNTKNRCSGNVPVLVVKNTRDQPDHIKYGGTLDSPFWPSVAMGRMFAYEDVEPGTTAVFDLAGRVGDYYVEEFDCPGISVQRATLACHDGFYWSDERTCGALETIGDSCSCHGGHMNFDDGNVDVLPVNNHDDRVGKHN